MDNSPDRCHDRATPAFAAGVHPSGAEPVAPGPQAPTLAELLTRVAELEGKLATLPVIEQAKGALMATYGITADAAFALLRFHSQHRNVKLRVIAAQLTTMMCTSPSRADVIARFDQLLDGVALSLQQPAAVPTTKKPERRRRLTDFNGRAGHILTVVTSAGRPSGRGDRTTGDHIAEAQQTRSCSLAEDLTVDHRENT